MGLVVLLTKRVHRFETGAVIAAARLLGLPFRVDAMSEDDVETVYVFLPREASTAVTSMMEPDVDMNQTPN